MVSSLCRLLWGDISREELKKFGFLSGILFFILGGYWMLRLLKKVIFEGTVTYDMQPRAKMLSVVILVGLVFLYQKLIDTFERNTLFYVVGSAYAIAFLLIAYFAAHPTIGLANTVRSPWRLYGWFSYCIIESFGTIGVQMFWSFVLSITTADSAKRGFPIIIAGAQLGSICGSAMLWNTKTFGVIPLVFIAAGVIAMVPLMVKLFVTFMPSEDITKTVSTSGAKKPKTGIFEGLRLMVTRPYLLCILGIATMYEVIGTIIEFQMDKIAIQTTGSHAAFAEFSGLYGISINAFTMAVSLLGTSFLLRRLGLATCLLVFPTIVGGAVVLSYFVPKLGLLALTMVLLKGLSYALNNPSKDMMYIPTSKDIKFKAKSWIDGFGGKTAKTSGAIVNDGLRLVTSSFSGFMACGSLIALGIVAVWLGVAARAGRAFNKLQEENKIVE